MHFLMLKRMVFALALAAGTVSLAYADGKVLRGGVSVVDQAKGTITIVTGEDGGKFYDLKLAKDAPIVIDDFESPAADLKECGFVEATLADDGKTVVKIKAFFAKEGDPIGFIKKLDVKGNEITLTRDGADKTYTISDKAKVVFNGKPAKLADIKDGAAYLRLRSDEVVILRVTLKKN